MRINNNSGNRIQVNNKKKNEKDRDVLLPWKCYQQEWRYQKRI